MAIEASLAVHEARAASKGYGQIRNRILSCSKRGSTDFDKKDKVMIREGNKAAHGGEALFDYTLYESCARFDFETFEKVYGVSYTKFPKIRRFTQFQLNARF